MVAQKTPEGKVPLEPRPRARAVLYVVGLALLAAESRFVDNGFVMIATAAALWVGGHVVATSIAPQRADLRLDRLTWNRCAPLSVLVPSVLAFLVLGLVGVALVANFELGPGFALWFIGFGGGELLRLILRRQADKGALLAWKPINPVRQSAVAGPALGVAIGISELVKGAPLRSALLAFVIVTLVATPVLVVLTAISRPRPD